MSIKRVAIVRTADNAVVNISVIDAANTDWQPPSGHTAVDDDGTAKIGGSYSGGMFSPPPPPYVPTPAEIAARLDALADAQFTDLENFIRAAVLMMLDEFNRHQAVHAAIISAAANSASYGAFRTAMAAITPVPVRTADQLKAALRSKLGV
jgi:hypothetical protein